MRAAEQPSSRRLDRVTTRLVTATGVSAVGDGLADVALGLFALSLTSDARLVTGVFVASRLPWLILGHTVANAVDRVRRPAYFMLAADAARALLLVVTTVLVASGHANLPLLYVTALVIGTGEIAHSAAAQVLLPVIASGDALAKANGYIGASLSAGYGIVGPALGGVIFGVGRALPFGADAASFAASGALLLPLRSVLVDPATDVATPDRATPDATEPTARAARPILGNPLLRVLLAQLLVLVFGQSMVLSTLPIFGRAHLGLSSLVYGLVLGASAIGNVAGSMAAPRLWAGRRHTVALLVTSGLLTGGTYVVMATIRNLPVAIVMLTLEGVAIGVLNTVSPTLRMEHAPAATRARVATSFTQLIFIMQPVGAVVAGLVTSQYGVTAAFALAGSLMILVMLLTDQALRRAVALVGA